MTLSTKNLRVIAPVAALLCLFAIVQAFSLLYTAHAANAVDNEKTGLALRQALRGQVDRIAGVASDNAYWDDAAAAVYDGQPDIAFIERSWGASTADGTNYDGAYVLRRDGTSIAGLRDGALDPGPADTEIRRAFSWLTRTSQLAGAGAGGIILVDGKPVLLGLSRILPTSRNKPVPLHEQAAWLVFIKRFDRPAIAAIGTNLLVEDLRVAAQPRLGTAIPINDIHGHVIAWLNWKGANPGISALRRALPLIGAAMLGALLLAVLIGRQGARSVSELARQALVDSLSNLPNRRALRTELKRRLDDDGMVALCLLDLDGFKFVNDNYGHSIGDRLIISCAEMLLNLVGTEGFVARLGGDEFAFVLSGETAWERTRQISDQILASMGSPFKVGERTVLIGASIGLAHGELQTADADELLRRADVAMYAAKRAGKMRVCVFDHKLDQRQARIHLIEREMRASLTDNSFRLVYQPLFHAASGDIASIEALLRWTSPSLGELNPVDFIPVAEESGLIEPLGLYILRRACEETKDWGDVRVAVNVSAAQLRNPDFPDHVRDILEQTGFSPARLELEITETYLVSDPETAGKVLQGLRALGVTIALDDFGTGYASIGFLRQFSFDKLKLDSSLVRDAENSDAARALLQASVAMARALNMEVAAEGVETDGQAALMRVAGCDQLQGWLFERALSGKDIARMIRADQAHRKFNS